MYDGDLVLSIAYVHRMEVACKKEVGFTRKKWLEKSSTWKERKVCIFPERLIKNDEVKIKMNKHMHGWIAQNNINKNLENTLI